MCISNGSKCFKKENVSEDYNRQKIETGWEKKKRNKLEKKHKREVPWFRKGANHSKGKLLKPG